MLQESYTVKLILYGALSSWEDMLLCVSNRVYDFITTSNNLFVSFLICLLAILGQQKEITASLFTKYPEFYVFIIFIPLSGPSPCLNTCLICLFFCHANSLSRKTILKAIIYMPQSSLILNVGHLKTIESMEQNLS
jgi:hypothetical protein